MRLLWQTATGHLACCWSEAGRRVQYNPPWMRETSESSYAPPVPDFASHSPFGGADWFQPTQLTAILSRSTYFKLGH